MQQNVNYSRETEKVMDRARAQGHAPRLLLHSCCAPCSSYCLEYLREAFAVTVFFYNPNITEQAEYEKRCAEELRLIEAYNRQVELGVFEQQVKTASSVSDAASEGGAAGQTAAFGIAVGEASGAVSGAAPEALSEAPPPFVMHSTPAAKKIDVLEAPYDPEKFLRLAKGLEDALEGGERCFRCYALRLDRTAQAAAAGGFDYFTTTLTISPLKNAAKLNELGQQAAKKYGVPFLPSDFKKKDGYKRSTELSAAFGLYRQNYCGCVYSQLFKKA